MQSKNNNTSWDYGDKWLVPPMYQEVEYLESTGMQWINTETYTRSSIDTSYIAEMKFTKLANHRQLFGCNHGGYFGISQNGYYEIGPNNVTQYSYNDSSLPFDTVMFLQQKSLNRQVLKINGNEEYYRTGYSDWRNDVIRLFMLNADTKLACFLRIKSFVIMQNGCIIRNFIPCYCIRNHAGGMYDTVTNTFFGNTGTGNFLVGPKVYN